MNRIFRLTTLCILAVMLASTTCLMAKSKKKQPEPPAHHILQRPIETQYDSLAYSFGLLMGQQYANFGDSGVVVPDTVLDVNMFLDAFISSMHRDTLGMRISLDEAQGLLETFSRQMAEIEYRKQEEALAKNKEAGRAFLASNGAREGVITLPSGVQVEHLVKGTGIVPLTDSNVKVNYRGRLLDGTVFDENEDVDFPLDGVIRGFSEGITQMQEGGRAIIYIPSEYGYGDRGAGQDIPGGSLLIFEIELVKVL